MHLSSENKAKLDKCTELMAQLSTRMDALFAKRAKADAEEAQWKADRAKSKDDGLDPTNEAVLTAYTPPTRPDNFLDIPPWEPPAWFPDEVDGITYRGSERDELRTGALSKERI